MPSASKFIGKARGVFLKAGEQGSVIVDEYLIPFQVEKIAKGYCAVKLEESVTLVKGQVLEMFGLGHDFEEARWGRLVVVKL